MTAQKIESTRLGNKEAKHEKVIKELEAKVAGMLDIEIMHAMNLDGKEDNTVEDSEPKVKFLKEEPGSKSKAPMSKNRYPRRK